jgi:hypothetical protein
MKKLLIITFSLVGLFLAGCLKDTPNVDFSNLSPIAELEYPAGAGGNGLGSGLEFFSGGALLFPPTDVSDTVTFMANIASPSPLGKAVNITVGIDANALTKYNNDPNNSVKYLPLPDSTYSLITTAGSIPAGSRLATFQFVFYPSKFANLDQTQSYMAPISITAADGTTISGNFSTIYLHTIGNPIAGPYLWDFTRWNNTDSTGPTSGGWTNQPTIFAPDDPTTIEVSSGYFVQPRYVVTFTNNGGVLSNFAVTLNADDVAYMVSNGVTVKDGPHVIVADPVNGVYEFQWQATVVSSGAPRFVVDRFHKN